MGLNRVNALDGIKGVNRVHSLNGVSGVNAVNGINDINGVNVRDCESVFGMRDQSSGC